MQQNQYKLSFYFEMVEWMSSNVPYTTALMVHRASLGVLAVLLNMFFIHVLRKFPIRDRAGHYKLTRKLLTYLAHFDLFYGVSILGQIIVYYQAENIYRTSTTRVFSHLETDNTTFVEFMTGENNPMELPSKYFGLIRSAMVRSTVSFILLLAILRLCFTAYPLASVRYACKITTKQVHAILICITLVACLVKSKIKNVKKLSACRGLLICEVDHFSCDTVTFYKACQQALSLAVCLTILVLIVVIWRIASKMDREMKLLLKIKPCFQTRNFKAVKTSLLIASIFLLSNSGSMANNIIKIICRLPLGVDSSHAKVAYWVADQFEQWLLPIMTVSNCIVYTATDKKIRKFVLWYYSNKIGSLCGLKRGERHVRRVVRCRYVVATADVKRSVEYRLSEHIRIRQQFYEDGRDSDSD